MKRLMILLFILTVFTASETAFAQTATFTPSPTQTPTAQPTYTPYPYSMIQGTIGVPTAIPGLSLTPKPWYTPTRMTAGAAFLPPTLSLDGTDTDEQAHGFEAISNQNVLKLGIFLAGVVVGFYGWLQVNFYTVLRALRMFSILVFLMMVLYALFRRFAPELASKANNWRQGEKSNKRGV